ncbi:MAG: hypothetical protein CME65_07355 [Halobacteriovoraceae bacterium]|nr:hypothetical protein [Halobacteriovoraceae bacterium]
MSVNQNSEHNILGCNVRISADNNNNEMALASVKLLKEEILKLREQKPGLREIDLAVMSALRIASRLQEVEADFKNSISDLKSGVEDAMEYIEQVSPGVTSLKTPSH